MTRQTPALIGALIAAIIACGPHPKAAAQSLDFPQIPASAIQPLDFQAVALAPYPEPSMASPRYEAVQVLPNAQQGISPAQEIRVTRVRPWSHREQRDRYLWGTFGPPGILGSAVSAAINQWRDSPEAWNQTPTGFAKRFTSEFAHSAITNSTKFLVARALDEDPSFRVCECRGVVRRLKHAALGPISARRPDGTIVLSSARVIGVATGQLASMTWLPSPPGPAGALKNVGVSLAGTLAVDILREFFFHRNQRPR